MKKDKILLILECLIMFVFFFLIGWIFADFATRLNKLEMKTDDLYTLMEYRVDTLKEKFEYTVSKTDDLKNQINFLNKDIVTLNKSNYNLFKRIEEESNKNINTTNELLKRVDILERQTLPNNSCPTFKRTLKDKPILINVKLHSYYKCGKLTVALPPTMIYINPIKIDYILPSMVCDGSEIHFDNKTINVYEKPNIIDSMSRGEKSLIKK